MPITKIIDEFDKNINYFTDEQLVFHTNKCYGHSHDRNCPTILIKRKLLPFLRSSLISLLEEDVRRMKEEELEVGVDFMGDEYMKGFNLALSQEIAYKNNQIIELKK